MPAVITGYARTPFVKYAGVFGRLPATELGARAIIAALERAGVAPTEVDFVYGGQVLQGGAGQNPARQSAIASGVPMGTPAITLNAVCLSGAEAVTSAARLIDAGEADIVVAVGQESMSLAPHAWSGGRAGKKYGAIEFLDTMDHDGLTDAFEHQSMGASTEARNSGLQLTREEQDAWSVASHHRLAASAKWLGGEIVAVTVPGRGGDTVIAADNGGRPDTTVETLAALRPAFGGGGTITAGNSSQLSDGAAAVVLMSEEVAGARGIRPLARILSHAFVAGPDVSLHSQPANAIMAALAKTDLGVADLAAVEINEAFAAVAVQSVRMLGVDPEIVNAHGGAIALGHPIGASGTRIVGTLARTLADAGPGSIGAAGICGGGGQGSAIVLEAT